MGKDKVLRVVWGLTVLLSVTSYVPGGVWYVDDDAAGQSDGSSWSDAFVSLTAALATARAGDEIRVAQGVYTPAAAGGARTASFTLKNAVTIMGGFAGVGAANPDQRNIDGFRAILSGDLNGDDSLGRKGDNSFHVVLADNSVDASAVVDGCVIMAGRADGAGMECKGAGVWTYGGSPVIRNCWIIENYAAGYDAGGTGVWIYHGSPQVINCRIENNRAVGDSARGGGLFNYSGSPRIADCSFITNRVEGWSAHGGGLANGEGEPEVVNCTFLDNVVQGTSQTYNSTGGGGIYSYAGNVTVRQCQFLRNVVAGRDGRGGGFWNYEGGVTLSQCVFRGNAAPDAHGQGGGVWNYEGTVQLDNCLLDGNAAGQEGGGLWNYDGSCVLTNNTLWGNRADTRGGGIADYAGTVGVVNSIVWGNEASNATGTAKEIHTWMGGVEVRYSCIGDYDGRFGAEGNISTDPLFVDAAGHDKEPGTADDDLYLKALSPCVDKGDNTAAAPGASDLDDKPRILGAAVDMGAYERSGPVVWYVDDDAQGSNDGSSWENAFSDLQAALAVVRPGESIFVAAGIYRPAPAGGDRHAAFHLVNGVTISGGWAGAAATDPDRRDVRAYASILSGDLNGDDGPGGYNNIDNSCHVVVAENVDSSAVLDGFTVTAGNAYVFDSGDDRDGAGLYSRESSAVVRNCTFTDNFALGAGGAIYHGGGDLMLAGCRFMNNTANSGGGAIYERDSGMRAINCLLVGNRARHTGGAVYCFDSAPAFVNCTIAYNTADDTGAGLEAYCSRVSMTNCIVWNNVGADGGAGSQISAYFYEPAVSYSCVQGGWPGEGNIDVYPGFADADGADNVIGTGDDNFRLLPGSACVDAGDNAAVGDDPGDLDGRERIEGGAVDMGPYEGPTQAFIMSRSRIDIREGSSAVFTVALAKDPGGEVRARLVISGDGDTVITSGTELVFTSANYAVPQTVMVAAGEDADNLSGTSHIAITCSLPMSAGVTVVEIDNDPVPEVLYVDDDASGVNTGRNWAEAYAHLQDALTTARAHGHVKEIRVAEGVYRPDQGIGIVCGDRFSSFDLVDGVAIRGGYAGLKSRIAETRDVQGWLTVLTGDLKGNDAMITDAALLMDEPTRGDNSFHVVTGSDAGPGAVLEGVTITGGNANGVLHWSGGGLINDSGSPTVVDCTFRANTATYDGGAVANFGDSVFSNCLFVHNAARGGGAMCNSRCYPVVANCRFIGNVAEGGGAVSESHDNDGAGSFIGCLFAGNRALTWCGGAVDCFISSTEIVNCTLVGNWAAVYGGGFFADDNCRPTIVNSILWDNSAGEAGAQIGINDCELTVRYCDVRGGSEAVRVTSSELVWAEGNVDVDPSFVDEAGGDYHLQAGSPCIDAGDNAAAAGIETDLDGKARVVNGAVDMGAYETAQPAAIAAEVRIIPSTINRSSRGGRVVAWIQLPAGVQRQDVLGMATWEPGPIAPLRQQVMASGRGTHERVYIIAFFDRGAVIAALGAGQTVEVTVSGELADGRVYSGTDTVKVVGKAPKKDVPAARERTVQTRIAVRETR